jgi:hypothetical protein
MDKIRRHPTTACQEITAFFSRLGAGKGLGALALAFTILIAAALRSGLKALCVEKT